MNYKTQWYYQNINRWVDMPLSFWTKSGAAKFAAKNCMSRDAVSNWRVIHIKTGKIIFTCEKP